MGRSATATRFRVQSPDSGSDCPASVAFGVVIVGLEFAFPEKVLSVLLNIVQSTCLLVWTVKAVDEIGV